MPIGIAQTRSTPSMIPGGYADSFHVLRIGLLGILGWGMPPGSRNPDPISDQKMSFFTPVFRPGFEEIMSSLLRTALILKIHFEFACFFFFLTHLELKR